MINWSKVLGFGLGLVMFFSAVWLVINLETKRQVSKYHTEQHIVQQQPDNFNWGPIATGSSSIILFLLKYFLGERKEKKKNKGSLQNHIVFDTIEDLISNDIKHLTFGSEGRTEAMRALLTIQLETYRRVLKEFIINNPTFEDSADFRKKLRHCIFQMVDETENNWRERQIPHPLIVKYSALYIQRIELLLSDILTATVTSSIENNEALDVFLNDARIVFLTGLQEDVMMALRSLNGELTGLTFNGKQL
jgi:hypothetical protein